MILNELKYRTIHGVSVLVPFYDTITVIGGLSSSGKTFIKDTVQERYNDVNKRLVEVFDYKAPVDLAVLRSLKNKFKIIDNADILLSENSDVSVHINGDANNQYLIFMRCENDIDVSADNYAELQEVGNLLTAVYNFRQEIVMIHMIVEGEKGKSEDILAFVRS
jgi:hypothetical protein